jgi:NADH-quinone oxidoreductase subunit G
VAWHGEDPLAAFAPEIQELAPSPGVRMAALQARECGLVAGEALRVRGPTGELHLPLVADPECARDVLGLSRSAMAVLGLTEGQDVEWERVT